MNPGPPSSSPTPLRGAGGTGLRWPTRARGDASADQVRVRCHQDAADWLRPVNRRAATVAAAVDGASPTLRRSMPGIGLRGAPPHSAPCARPGADMGFKVQ